MRPSIAELSSSQPPFRTQLSQFERLRGLTEAVFFRPQAGELLPVSGPNEGVGFTFLRNTRRKCDLAKVAQRFDFVQPRTNCLVVRLRVGREARIGERIFVPAIECGV